MRPKGKNLLKNLNKASKKKIVITGGKGLLGSNFYIKYKKQYNIIRYPNRFIIHTIQEDVVNIVIWRKFYISNHIFRGKYKV